MNFDLTSLTTLDGTSLMRLWNTLTRVPGGRAVFSRAIGRMAPYTGTIGARVVDLKPGYARVELKDRRAVRNHLDSIHAVALVNLAEETTGLAIMAGLPEGARGILKGLAIEYLKKARGTLTGECTCDIPASTERKTYVVEGLIRDRSGDVVARAEATWLIGPRKS